MPQTTTAADSQPPDPTGSWLDERLRQYAATTTVYDEALDASGGLRAGWQPLIRHLGELTPADLQQRSSQAQRQIEKDGVVFNPHDAEGGSRPWRLDPIPLVIAQESWQAVARGLEQRGQLANLILLDLLGPQTLLHERIVPPELLFANPNYFPAYHDLVARPRQHVHLYAADLARNHSGTWCVSSNRTRAPSGLGFILENRLITNRLLPGVFSESNVLRLAAFFARYKESLASWSDHFRDNPRIALWSRGPNSRLYFEDAYLARYLGYTLVESNDLAVRQGRVMLKTLGGLIPLDVILRRLDDRNCDPSELEESTGAGVAGLLDVIRDEKVALANSIGSSYLEAPMLACYLQQICQHFFGEDLILPSVPTWWCGTQQGLSYVESNFEHLEILRAFRTDDSAPIRVGWLSADQQDELRQRIRQTPGQFVARSPVQRSTTPVWNNGGLEPWQLALRGFSVAGTDGSYSALPSALARVAPDGHALSRDMTSGEKSQDVWIVAASRVRSDSLLVRNSRQIELQRIGSDLPSRVAEDLYWLGRYLERAEQAIRLVRLTLQRVTSDDAADDEVRRLAILCESSGQLKPTENEPGDGADEPQSSATQIDSLGANPQSQSDGNYADLPERLIHDAFDQQQSHSLISIVSGAFESAGRVRDRVSLDSYRVIAQLHDQICRNPSAGIHGALDMLPILDEAVDSLAAISGLASESMTRTLGWRFLDLGRRIERACQTVALIAVVFDELDEDPSGELEDCLYLFDSFMTYRNRYLASIEVAPVLDLLVADESNPRSLISQLAIIAEHVEALPRPESSAMLSEEQRLSAKMYNQVRLENVIELAQGDDNGKLSELTRLVEDLAEGLPKLSDCLTSRFLIHAGTFQRHFSRSPASAS